jgi:hypothetical protein
MLAGIMTYDSETVVRDGMVAVHPGLDGQRVRVIVIPIADQPVAEPAMIADGRSIDDAYAAAIPGVRIAPLSRDDCHER